MCGTVWKLPHNQVFREVISNQAVNFVPIEQVSAQSVPCMWRHITHISNWFGCPETCLTNSTFFHSFSNVIGNAWPEYRVSCFEHTLFNTQMSIVYLFQCLLPKCGRYEKSGSFSDQSILH